MRTWEMIKELTEHPSKEFKNEYGSIIHHNGLELRWKDDRSRVDFTNKFINGKWEEVKQPVTCQEALEAWAKGAVVKCEINDDSGFTLFYKSNYLYPEDGDEITLCSEEILKGTWYILGEEAKTNE